MSGETDSEKGVTTQAFRGMHQNIKVLARQIERGRVDKQFLMEQIEKLEGMFDDLKEERQQLRQSAQFEALYKVSRLLGSSLDLQVVLDQVMDAVLELTGGQRGFLMLHTDDGRLEVKVARNFSRQTLDNSESFYSETIADEVLEQGQAIVTTNAMDDPRYAEKDSIVTQSLRSIMATPLRVRGKIIGVAYVDSRVVADLFDETDLNALEALGGQAAIAIENAQLFEHTDQALEERISDLTQLRQVDLLLNETLATDRVLQLTLEWAVKLSGSTSGYLGLLQPDELQVENVCHFGIQDPSEATQDLETEYGQAIFEAVDTQAPVTLQTQTRDKERQILVMPLGRAQAIGVIVLYRDERPPYSDREIDLTGRVLDRAAVAIENGRLYDAVQRNDRTKSEFVATVAHDMKVPMTSIMGYANLIQLSAEDHQNLVGRQDEFLEKIVSTVERMVVLIDDLADISRIESGHFYMDEAPVSLKHVLDTVRDTTRIQMVERQHRYVEQVEPNLPDLYTDYYRLLQVLINLVSNAYKYTPDGGKITMCVRRAGDRVSFTVKDTGIGLNEEQIAKLGTKFWRAEDDYTRNQRGTGLGFAISERLVRLMGSKIHVESEIGKGSTFTFTVATIDNSENRDNAG